MKKLFIPSAFSVLAGLAAAAPIALPGSMHYTQNFDNLAKSPSNGLVAAADNWSDDTTLPGWYFFQAGNGTPANTKFAGTNFPYRATDGGLQSDQPGTLINTGWFYSMGTAVGTGTNGDRALGVVPISAQGELSYLAVFQNTAATPLKLTQVSYNAEIWRTNQSAAVVETMMGWWKKAATKEDLLNMSTAAVVATDWNGLATTPNSYYVTGWNRLASADYTYTSTVANTKTYESHPVSASPTDVEIQPGEFFAIRWGNFNDKDADALMGIDDLDLTFATANYTIAGAASNVVRNDNGTPRNPNDDTVSFDLLINGSGAVGPAWVVSAPASLTTVTGSYGVPVSVTGVPISAFTGSSHTVVMTVADQANAGFTTQVQAAAPWTQLTALAATGFAYLDHGTASTTDDQVTFSISADGTFTGTGFTATAGATSAGTAAYGAPLAITAAAPGTFTTYTLADNVDPASTTTLSVFPPAIIGTNATTLSPRPLLSLPVAQNGALVWNVNAAAGTIQQTGAVVQEDYVLTSEVVDISTAPDVTFSATLAAVSGASSGFEPADSFALDLIIDGGAPVSVLGASDTNADGRLVGGTELQTAASTTRTFNFTYPIPAAANTVQVRITGNSNSTAETFTLSALKLEIPQPGILLTAASNIVRNANGPGLADDTVSFDVTVSGVNGGTGWTTTSATPVSGAFGVVTFTVPAGPKSATVRVTDNTFPNAFADVTIPLPGPYAIGTYDLGAGSVPMFTDVVAVPDAAWVIGGPPPTLTMNGLNLVAPLKTVTSEVITVTGAAGALKALAHLHVHDTSAGFETGDEFNAYVILNGDTVNLLSMIPAALDTDGSGFLNATELCPVPPVNPTIQDFDYALSANIPANTNTVQIVITGLCNSTNENMIVSGISVGAGAADTDSDGISDAYEDANGLDKLSAADRDLDLDGDGQSNYQEFLAGTSANSSASFLHITGGTLNTATGAGSSTWTSVAGKRYRIQLSGDLAVWTDTGTIITATGTTTTANYTITGAPLTGKGYLRVKVVP